MGKEKTDLMQQKMFTMTVWAMFIIITLIGLNAFMIFPVQAGYGSVATFFFRLMILAVLALTGCKFFYDIERLNQLYKSR